MSELNKMDTHQYATQKIVYTNHLFNYYFVSFCVTFKGDSSPLFVVQNLYLTALSYATHIQVFHFIIFGFIEKPSS
jgi:hypothetical protein